MTAASLVLIVVTGTHLNVVALRRQRHATLPVATGRDNPSALALGADDSGGWRRTSLPTMLPTRGSPVGRQSARVQAKVEGEWPKPGVREGDTVNDGTVDHRSARRGGRGQVNRRDLNPEMQAAAKPSGRSRVGVWADIRRVLANTALPPGCSARFGSSTQAMLPSRTCAVSALTLGMTAIGMIPVSPLGSFMTLPGRVAKHAAGLLIDLTAGLRAPGLTRCDALMQAARVRQRPRLTAMLVGALGRVPLPCARRGSAAPGVPLGRARIGGVSTNSLLTVVAPPVIHCCGDDLAQWLTGLGRRHQAEGAPIT
jgi:hypothetical protein